MKPQATSATAASCTTQDVTMESMLETVKLFRKQMDEHRRKRDEGFAMMRSQGKPIWAWDEYGSGETWVVGDSHYGELVKELPIRVDAQDAIGGGIGSVRILRLSMAVAMGFSPFSESRIEMEDKPPA